MPMQLQLLQLLDRSSLSLMYSRAGDKHHTMDCYTEGIAKLSITKILRGGGGGGGRCRIKISVFQVERTHRAKLPYVSYTVRVKACNCSQRRTTMRGRLHTK